MYCIVSGLFDVKLICPKALISSWSANHALVSIIPAHSQSVKVIECSREWACSYGGYREDVGRPVCRLEVPRDRGIVILGFGDRLLIKLASYPG
jgi:hypothetical protein